MFVALAVAQSFYPGVQAFPIIRAPAEGVVTSCEGIEDYRTIWTIVWSCLVTMAACTWVAVHMNVPSLDEGKVNRTLRRIGIMMIAVVAPEFMVGWAARQYMVAGRLAKSHVGWTRTHGFFALMGGFMLYDGDQPIHALSPDELETRVADHSIDLPIITEEEIEDRSKGDALSKGVALVHTTWFTIQVIARGIRRLPITELEMVALAFTVLNVATYSLWWSKPLSVQRPVRVPLKPKQEKPTPAAPESTTPLRVLLYFLIVCGILVGFTGVCYGFYILAKRKHFKISLGHGVFRVVDTVVDIVMVSAVVLVIVLLAASVAIANIIVAFVGATTAFFGMGLGFAHDSNALHLSTFYDGGLKEEEQKKFQTFILPTIAVVFGAIHCIAWQYDFPTHLEQMLWRMAAVAITCSPVVMTMASGWAHSSGQEMSLSFDNSWWFVIFMIFSWLVFVFYLVSRITLLAIAFSSLRSLPSGAFEVISWTSYIPHF
ncbi:hypothetical protein JAAARDRAFT_205745 [Jaapia argillacea MUCL 33604]|uniref:Uncharacterized protein n=1 Tax=Jaapia argillacea MUCL 33604 TaxID=933084 RepID=A0A067Q8E5_9AGAM|nr:hypothetical protein JAAARDRAFT_205745 [Jaapia argillacea MUCL 33604]